MTSLLTVAPGPPADDLRPSYEEAIAEGPPVPIRPPSIADSIPPLSLLNGILAPASLRLRHIGRHPCLRSEVTSLAITPRGLVAVSQEDPSGPAAASTRLWDFRARSPTACARLISSEVDDCPVIIYSGNGKLNATVERAAGARRVKIRESESKTRKSSLGGVGRPAAFSHDGAMFAATDSRGVVFVFEAVPGAPSPLPASRIAAVVNHAEPTHVLFMPNGADVVTLSRDGTVRISEARTGRTLRRMEVDGGTGTGTGACALGVSPDGRVVVSVWAKAVYVWEHESGRMTGWELNKVRASEGWPLAISPDCRLLACRNEDGMDVSDVYSGQVLAEVETAPGLDGLVTAAAFSADGRIMAVGRYSGLVDVYDTRPMEAS